MKPPPLDDLEIRVLGVLIEKSLATPDQYPLSLHALVAGCNQKSNRDPQMLVSEPEVRLTIDGLRMKHLAGISNPAGARVERYTHAAAETLTLNKPGLAVLAELLLRGPQARGELRSRASRMTPIESLDELGEILERLRDKGYAAEHAPAPGSRAPRIAHALDREGASADEIATGTPNRGRAGLEPPGLGIAAPRPASPPSAGSPDGVSARVTALETEVATLRRQLESLASKLGEPLEDA